MAGAGAFTFNTSYSSTTSQRQGFGIILNKKIVQDPGVLPQNPAKILASGMTPTGTTSKTITIPAPDDGRAVLLFIGNNASVTQVGSGLSWIRDYHSVLDRGLYVFRRRPTPNGPMTFEFTQNGARSVSWIAVQGDFGLPVHKGWVARNDTVSDTYWPSGLHTYPANGYQLAVAYKSEQSTAIGGEVTTGTFLGGEGTDGATWPSIGDSGTFNNASHTQESGRLVLVRRPTAGTGVDLGVLFSWNMNAGSAGALDSGIMTWEEGTTAGTPPNLVDTPPGPVTGLTAVVGQNNINLSWTNPTGETDYNGIVVRRANGATPPATVTVGTSIPVSAGMITSVNNTGLTASTQYSYAVFVRDNAGLYSVANNITRTTLAPPPDAIPPGPITALTVGATTTNSVTMSWSNPTDPDLAAVIVRRADGAIAPNSPTAGLGITLSSATATSMTDSGLTPSTQYSYAFFTRDASNNINSV